MLLGLRVWPIGDEHRTVRLLPHRLCVAGRGNSASELPGAGSDHFAVERVDLLHDRFGYGGRVEVVGEVVSNQILWHDFFSLFSVFCFLWLVSDDSFSVHSGTVAHRSLSYSRWGDGKSTAIPNFISTAESAPAGISALVPVG